MTPEAKSLACPDEKRHDVSVAGDEPCMSLGWSRSANCPLPAC